jgi:GR25 family glycosyltransferase involved in LPS biosynthesis
MCCSPPLDAVAHSCQFRMMSSTPAFYINLDTRSDRREHTERQLARIGLVAERVSAVTPADIPVDRIAAAARHMSATELACSFSHRKIWQMMVDRKLDGALILEDDALLSASIVAVLAVATLPETCDALQFESHPTDALLGPPVPLAGGIHRHRLMSSSLGTCAYYITGSFAAKMLARDDLDTLAVDRILFGRGGKTIYLSRIYQAVPALAVQLDMFARGQNSAGRSDLMPSRLRSPRPKGLAARLDKLGLNASHALRILTSFAPTGELFGARQLKLPIADDIKAQL